MAKIPHTPPTHPYTPIPKQGPSDDTLWPRLRNGIGWGALLRPVLGPPGWTGAPADRPVLAAKAGRGSFSQTLGLKKT